MLYANLIDSAQTFNSFYPDNDTYVALVDLDWTVLVTSDLE